ncbi:protein eyes shut homolog [Sphaerodactylus townsendi]|uniref:protein eyes shut homolog n=1 Tax=Sphaerodactylus townsendi TaxID=933632 RepID=UPI002026B540|nr:protein eyes shut homolog [Sphaerodactylus townsendi]
MAGSELQKHKAWTHGTDEPEEDLTASVSIPLSQAHRLSAVASTIIPYQLSFSDFSYIQYEGDSYVEFDGFQLHPQNNIHLEFHTTGLHGVIFYIEQNPTTIGQSFIQLSVKNGILQYQFACNSGGEARNVSTDVRVNNGMKYRVHIW